MSPAEDVVEDERAKRRRFRHADFLGNTDEERSDRGQLAEALPYLDATQYPTPTQ